MKFAPDAVLDKIADYIIAQATKLYICSDQPSNFAGIAAVALADVDMSSSDFTKSNGDASGRKVRVAQKSNIAIDATGEADHVVLASDSELLYVTTCTLQALTEGGTVTTPAWDIEISDPT